MVNEDVESEEEDRGDEEDDPDVVDLQLQAQLIQSPERESQASEKSHVSATSRVSSSAEGTTHSEDESRNLSPALIEVLPSLYDLSCRILKTLAPPNFTPQLVERTMRELGDKELISTKILRHTEQKYGDDRRFYGSDNDRFINPAYIYKALFGGKVPVGTYRMDPILHAANLATIMKDIFRLRKDDPEMQHLLVNLDDVFPKLFMEGVDNENDAILEKSKLWDESFALALEIRTQCAIVFFATNEEEYTLENVLLDLFFEKYAGPPPPRQVSNFEHIFDHGQVKNIRQSGSENSNEQDTIIKSRVKELQIALQPAGDDNSIDFDLLEESFPWFGFLSHLGAWSRKRLDEITMDISSQGGEGVEDICKSLSDAVKLSHNEDSIDEPPVPPSKAQQQAGRRTITPAHIGQK